MPHGTSETSLNARAVFHAWQLLQKTESLQQVFTKSLPTAWGIKKKKNGKWIPQVLNDTQ